jgi:hypothetical protein
MAARQFVVPTQRHISPVDEPWYAPLAAVALMMWYMAWPIVQPDGPFVITLFLGTPFALILLSVLISSWRTPKQPEFDSVEVGADGVRAGSRFVAYAEMKRVSHTCGKDLPIFNHSKAYEYEVERSEPRDWSVSIWLADGDTLEIVTQRSGVVGDDRIGAELSRVIKEALAARARDRSNEGAGATLVRAERTGAEWLKALRDVGSGVGASYRSAATDTAALSRLLDDPQARPSNRAAAAIVLAVSGDQTAVSKLRVAAKAMASPRVRVALENVASETAVAEALEELEELERAQEPKLR